MHILGSAYFEIPGMNWTYLGVQGVWEYSESCNGHNCILHFCNTTRIAAVQLKESEKARTAWEERQEQLEKCIEENSERINYMEKNWLDAQALCKALNEQLSDSQSQVEALDKKYSKAKKLLKEHQQK